MIFMLKSFILVLGKSALFVYLYLCGWVSGWVGEWGFGACVCACGLKADIYMYICIIYT